MEKNHDLKPDLLDGIELTAAEILALWAVPDLRERLQRIARARVLLANDEDDLELASVQPPPPLSMFDQFAGVFHAFGSLRRRIDTAMDEKAPKRAARAIWGGRSTHRPTCFASPPRPTTRAGLRHLPVYTSAEQPVTHTYPELVEQFGTMLAQFHAAPQRGFGAA